MIYLLLYDRTTEKQFKKEFATEWERDKFKRQLRYSTKLKVLSVGGFNE